MTAIPHSRAASARRTAAPVLALLALILSALIVAPAPARSDVVDPPKLIAELGNRTLAILHETAPDSSSRFGRFHALVAEKFDVPLLARFVTGRFWDTATDAERHRFTVAFSNYVTELFTARFSHYTKQSFAIVGARDEPDGTAIVSSEIVEPNAASGDRVDWRVAKTGTGLKITDVSVSGVSVAQAKRAEFGSLLARSRGGIAGLAAALETRSARQTETAKGD